MDPPRCLALSLMIVHTYQHMDHGAHFTSAMAASCLILAAIIYVHDTDLLHWDPTPTTLDKELIEYVENAGNDWGHLLQESRGIL